MGKFLRSGARELFIHNLQETLARRGRTDEPVQVPGGCYINIPVLSPSLYWVIDSWRNAWHTFVNCLSRFLIPWCVLRLTRKQERVTFGYWLYWKCPKISHNSTGGGGSVSPAISEFLSRKNYTLSPLALAIFDNLTHRLSRTYENNLALAE